jgi:hypothetical protein
MNLFQAVRIARSFSAIHPQLRQLGLFAHSDGPCWFYGLKQELLGLKPAAGVQALLVFVEPLVTAEADRVSATYRYWGQKLAEVEKADRLQLTDLMQEAVITE